ncbi:hypothetical protein BU17DRAFT_39253 [Hysterangium stoloniferum]|nr:hypothetical protein BU17DRAFT_39253 [Hysterangium stoloniferum]
MPKSRWGDVKYDPVSTTDDTEASARLVSPLAETLDNRLLDAEAYEIPLTPALASVDATTTIDVRPYEKDSYNPVNGPPPLSYPIQTKRWSLISTWSIIILLNTILPVTIFYVLRHGNILTHVILNISQIPMTPTLFQFPYRLWQLKRRNGERSPREHGLFTWDFFQWQFFFGAALTTAICAVAGTLESYHLFALAPLILFGEVCLQVIIFNTLARFKVSQPCRISSVPKGEPFRPGVYYVIEDLTAVDGGGGVEFRDELLERWNASLPFQSLVYNVGWILGTSGICMVLLELGLMMTTPIDIFFGLSWVILWAWAGLGAYYCIRYTKSRLKAEKLWWDKVVLNTDS